MNRVIMIPSCCYEFDHAAGWYIGDDTIEWIEHNLVNWRIIEGSIHLSDEEATLFLIRFT